MARNRRVRKNRKKLKQEDLEALRELVKDGYVDDLTSPVENSPTVSWEAGEEETDFEDCCSEDDFEETEEEREWLEGLEEGIKEAEDPDEADPWLWMEEYDGYDEEFYSDEDP